MQRESVYHQPYGSYAYPINQDTLFLQLRTKKGEIEKAYVMHDGKFNWTEDSPRNRVELEKYCSDKSFDYFRVAITSETKRFRYYFLLDDGSKTLYYTEYGLQEELPTRKEGFEYQNICEKDIFKVPEWVENAVFYQIFPERFANGNPDLDPEETKDWSDREPESDSFYGGDLEGIINNLDYIEDLGVNAIYLTPVFPSSSNHKYNVRDYKAIDPQFGDLETAKELVDKAHQKGIKVIFDAVFNHSSDEFFAFKDLREKGRESDYADWYYYDELPIKKKPNFSFAKLINLFSELRQGGIDFATLQEKILPEYDIDYDQLHDYEQEFLKLITERFKSDSRLQNMSDKELWLLMRNDEEIKELMGPNYTTFANGAWFMPKLKTANAEVRDYLLDVARFWIEEVGIDGWRLDVADEVDQFFWREFRKVVKQADPEAYIVGETWKDATRWLKGDQFDGVMNYIFSEAVLDFFCRREIDAKSFNHRLTRVKVNYKSPAQLASLNLIGSHDTARALTIAENDKTRLSLAAAFQMTYLGPPMLYYGDEVGMAGGDDPDCRRPMIWEDDKQDQNLLNWYKKLIRIRQENPALRTGKVEVVTVDSLRGIYAFARVKADNRLLVVFNNDSQDNQVEFSLEELPFNTDEVIDLVSESEYQVADGQLKLELDSYSMQVLKEK